MPEEPAKRTTKQPRGGKRPGAGRPSLGKEMVKAYLPRELVRRLEKLAQKLGLTKSKIIENALRVWIKGERTP
jgi:hypothetical protein